MDLDDFVATLSRYALLIALLVLTAGGAAFVIGQVLPKTFESEAVVLVGSLTETRSDQLLAYQRLAQTYAEIGTSETVMGQVIARLDLKDKASDLERRVDIRSLTGQAILRITAQAPSQTAATDLANTVADELTLLGKPVTGTSLASVFQPATSPGEPATPRILLNVVIGALLGLAIGVGLAVLLGRSRSARRSTNNPPPDERVQWPT